MGEKSGSGRWSGLGENKSLVIPEDAHISGERDGFVEGGWES